MGPDDRVIMESQCKKINFRINTTCTVWVFFLMQGFKYIYLRPDDFKKVSAYNSVRATLIEDQGESRYKLTDIIGRWSHSAINSSSIWQSKTDRVKPWKSSLSDSVTSLWTNISDQIWQNTRKTALCFLKPQNLKQTNHGIYCYLDFMLTHEIHENKFLTKHNHFTV